MQNDDLEHRSAMNQPLLMKRGQCEGLFHSQSDRMRWVFLILVTLWVLLGMIIPAVVFLLVHSLLSLSLFGNLAPPLYILYRMARYLFPKDDRDYEIEAIKALYGIEPKQRSKGQAVLGLLEKSNLLSWKSSLRE